MTTKMKTPLLLSLCFVIATAGRLFAQRSATAHTGNTSTHSQVILRQLLSEPGLENTEVQMLVVDFPPHSVSAAHRHPCPTFGYVLEGNLESVFEGKTHVYKQGHSFYEVSNGLHSVTRNPHPTKPAKLLVFFLAGKDQPTSLPEKK